MTGSIRTAATLHDFTAFGALVVEYVDWCRGRYKDHAWFVERVFGHQSLADELAVLQSAYSPPSGKALLWVVDGEACGAGAYRRLPDGTCEMKRLFVPDRFKGQGIGRALCAGLIESARQAGFGLMRLDTADLFREAIGMYEAFGFVRCDPHLDYPPELMRHLVFMELPLTQAA